MVYQTFSSLINGIENELENALNEGGVRDKAKNSLSRSVQEQVYNRKSSGDYRTGALKASSDTTLIKSDGGLLLSVFNNPEKMNGFIDSYGNEAHTSWVTNNTQHENIVLWTVEGNEGSPLYSYRGRNFISYAYDDITNNMVKWIRQSLQARGVKTL